MRTGTIPCTRLIALDVEQGVRGSTSMWMRYGEMNQTVKGFVILLVFVACVDEVLFFLLGRYRGITLLRTPNKITWCQISR